MCAKIFALAATVKPVAMENCAIVLTAKTMVAACMHVHVLLIRVRAKMEIAQFAVIMMKKKTLWMTQMSRLIQRLVITISQKTDFLYPARAFLWS